MGRVENWRSSKSPISSSPSSNPVFTGLSRHLLPVAFTDSPAWPSDIVSSEVPESFQEFQVPNAFGTISFPSFLQKRDEGIAPSPDFHRDFVVLEILAVI
jgi:hypothetical protein